MSQPVKVSGSLVLDARLMSEASHRSIAGQIEYWANIGRGVEMLLRADKLLALAKAGKSQPLSECLKAVETAGGRDRLKQHLQSLPYPHYEPAPDAAGLLVRIEADGQRSLGRFVNRKFQMVKKLAKKSERSDVQLALAKVKDPNILVNIISRRVRQLNSCGAKGRPRVSETAGMGAADIALKEIIEDNIGFEIPEESTLTPGKKRKRNK